MTSGYFLLLLVAKYHSTRAASPVKLAFAHRETMNEVEIRGIVDLSANQGSSISHTSHRTDARVAGLAEISPRSPRILFIFII